MGDGVLWSQSFVNALPTPTAYWETNNDTISKSNSYQKSIFGHVACFKSSSTLTLKGEYQTHTPRSLSFITLHTSSLSTSKREALKLSKLSKKVSQLFHGRWGIYTSVHMNKTLVIVIHFVNSLARASDSLTFISDCERSSTLWDSSAFWKDELLWC